MGTITIKVDDEIERTFKMIAKMTYSKRKRYLEKAITDAMENWINEKKQGEIAEDALNLMEKSFDFGKRLYEKRTELHG